MSIQLKNEIRELRGRIEQLERKMNVVSPEKRIIAGTPEPEREKPQTKTRKKKG